MQLGLHEFWQTAVEFLGVTDNARGSVSVQHSLQPVCNDLRRPGENGIAVIHMGRHESVDECGSRLKSRVIVGCDGVVVVWKSQQHKSLATCLSRLRSCLIKTRSWHQEDGHARWQWQCLLQAVNLVHSRLKVTGCVLCRSRAALSYRHLVSGS